ncbi:MAG TPA: manganese efflux pump [Methanotrichaceae archaeon]|nr:manganese efflux pump [Methanotrichaceae archaeon]
MNLVSVALIGFALSVDVFAFSLTGGVMAVKDKTNHALKIAILFGSSQAIMPLLGWVAGFWLADLIFGIDHWIAFGLLSFLGVKTIYESLFSGSDNPSLNVLDFTVLAVLALTTSLDSMAVGMTFAFLDAPIVMAAMLIRIVTFTISILGFALGDRFTTLFPEKIDLLGGFALLGIGVNMLF